MLCRVMPLLGRSNCSYLNQGVASLQGVARFHVSAESNSSKSDLAAIRKKTGYSLSICKKALSENNNDLKLAEEWLKEQAQAQGWAKAQKLQGRNTSQGLVGVRVKGDIAAVVELNCETDFVARNKKFMSILDSMATTCLNLPPPADLQTFHTQLVNSADVGLLKTESGSSLADLIALNIGQIGENMAIGSASVIFCKPGSGVKLAGLSHPNLEGSKDTLLFGRYITLMAYTQSGEGVYPEGLSEERLVTQICQHIIGMAPTSVENEEEKENSLLHQPFLIDEDMKVGELTAAAGIKILHFLRREVGRHE